MSGTIAVDARLLHYNRTGIGRYIRLLYDAMAALPDAAGRNLQICYARKDAERALARRWPRTATLVTPAHHRLERWTLAAELVRLRPALLHAPDHVAPQPLGWRTVVTVHDLAFVELPGTHSDHSRAYYAGVGRTVAQAARVICVSHATRSSLLSHYDVAPEKVRVVWEAPDPVYGGSPDGRLPFAPPERPYFVFVGTIEPRKNVARIIGALAALLRGGAPPADLVVVGSDGDGAGDLRALPGRLGIAGHVRFTGRQEAGTVAALYRGAAAVVYPSLLEGFGLPILEAMAAGAPVITSNRSSMPEVAGQAAILVDPEDEAQIAHAMRVTLEDDATRARMVLAGRERAASFSWERAARETLAVFDEALAA